MMKLAYKHQRPDQIVRTEGWAFDSISYEEGTREKSTVFPPQNLPVEFLKPTHRYLSKKSIKRAPVQFWMEIVAYRFGCLCGVPVPPSFISVDAENECRALIEWFYEEGKHADKYLPGYSILRKIDSEMDKEKGKRHSIDIVMKSLEYMEKDLNKLYDTLFMKVLRWLSKETFGTFFKMPDYTREFTKIFVFDALISNTDRHHENWGIIFNIKGTSRGEAKQFIELAPAFDNGTSLGYDYPEETLSQLINDPNWLNKYLKKGTHHLRKEPGGDHFRHDELIEVLLQQRPDLKPLVEEIISFDMAELRAILNELTEFDVPVLFTPERAEFTARLIEAKRDALKTVVDRC